MNTAKLFCAVAIQLMLLTGCATGGKMLDQPIAAHGISYHAIPAQFDGNTLRLESKLYMPATGDGPYPLVIMTHGRDGAYPSRREQEVDILPKFCAALNAKGLAVLMVVRRGYGRSEGNADAEFLRTPEASALAGAQDLAAAVRYAHTLPGIDHDKIVVTGHSQGGWIAVGASTLPMEGVIGTVNFSGAINFSTSIGQAIRSKGVEGPIERSAGILGAASRYPMLWVYSDNDNHSLETAQRWLEAYRHAGGHAELAVLHGLGHNTANGAAGAEPLVQWIHQLSTQ